MHDCNKAKVHKIMEVTNTDCAHESLFDVIEAHNNFH